jgi:hypothetical protein
MRTAAVRFSTPQRSVAECWSCSESDYENEAPCEGRLFGLGAMFTLNLVSLGYQVNSFKRSPIVVFSLV